MYYIIYVMYIQYIMYIFWLSLFLRVWTHSCVLVLASVSDWFVPLCVTQRIIGKVVEGQATCKHHKPKRDHSSPNPAIQPLSVQ